MTHVIFSSLSLSLFPSLSSSLNAHSDNESMSESLPTSLELLYDGDERCTDTVCHLVSCNFDSGYLKIAILKLVLFKYRLLLTDK